VATGIGLSVTAFETDLAGYGFGWRQGVAALSVGAIALGVLPVVAEAAGGRWGLPSSGYEAAVALPASSPTSPGYRALWLSDPRVLPSGGWSIGPGLAYATSSDGPPTLLDVWPPASPGPAGRLADALRVAMRGETVQLGRVLAAARVRYVIVLTAFTPRAPGTAAALTSAVPAGLVAALARQEDLRTVPVSASGVTVFENTAFASAAAPTSAVAVRGGAVGAAGVLDPLGAVAELCAWLVAAAALLGRRRWLDWWWRPFVRARRARRERRARRRHVVQEQAQEPARAGSVDLVIGEGSTAALDVPELVAIPADGQPADGQPADGAPPDGQPAHGAPPDGQPAHGAPPDGQPAHGAPPDGHETLASGRGAPRSWSEA